MESRTTMILEIEGKKVEVDDSFKSLDPQQQEAQVAEIAKSFAPAPKQETPSTQGQGFANPLMAGVVGAGVGEMAGPAITKGSEAFMETQKLIKSGWDPKDASDFVRGKYGAVENWGRQMHGGKFYGGEDFPDAWRKGMEAKYPNGIPPNPTAPAAAPAGPAPAGMKAGPSGLFVPESFEAASGAKPAAAGGASRVSSMGAKAAASPTLQSMKSALGAASSRAVPAVIGRGVAGFSAGMQGADAYNRLQQGDVAGGVISGLGALGSAAAFVPHPVVRGVGTAVGIGAEALNAYLDSLKKKKQPQQMAEGGLVDRKDGLSKAEKAALLILRNKKKVKHFADGGSVDHPNIALPAMSIDEKGVATPTPIQVWNEATGTYQSSADTTPGVMPGPIGGLGGLLAGENPAVTTPTPVSTTQPTNTDAFMLSGPLGGVNANVAQTTNPFANIGSIAQQGDTFQPTQQNVSGAIPQANPPFQTQNLLNPQSPLQAAPNSPAAAASTPKVNFASAMRPGVTQNATNRFGTQLNQVRQAGVATPQARRPMATRLGLPNLARFRRP